MTNNKKKAADAAKEKKQEITKLLNSIKGKVEAYVEGEKVDWGHVGSLSHALHLLKEIDQNF